MPRATTSSKSAVKRRSCDECRSRKLACSKDPAGCDRCKRETISCQYSEQKPMGRPRKRRLIDAVNNDEPKHHTQDLPVFVDNNNNFVPIAEPYVSTGRPVPSLSRQVISDGLMNSTGSGNLGNFCGTKAPMDEPHRTLFGEIGLGPGTDEASILKNSTPLSAVSELPSSEINATTCACLSSMYLSLAALQEFPSDIPSALLTVRGAAVTAATSIWCPQCGSCLLSDPSPPIESFQNLMLLGTILPIIANGYKRLLKMVDVETDAATVAGQTKIFRLEDYGGYCMQQKATSADNSRLEKDLFIDDVEVPPKEWRDMVRALLKIDISGHQQAHCAFKGLKDLLAEIEFRQRSRHEFIDAYVALGADPLVVFGHFTGQPTHHCPDKEQVPPCLQILNAAKLAIDNIFVV